MQLRVEKSDGNIEVYLHTKVMGTIARALSESDGYLEGQPEQLAEAVTIYLRRRFQGGTVASDEINSMIEVVLYDTGHARAALELHEHRIRRQMKRGRVEVVSCGDSTELCSTTGLLDISSVGPARLWNKTEIVQSLKERYGIEHNLARAVGGMVEEKVLALECRQVTSSLVRELVASEMLCLMQAERSLSQDIVETEEISFEIAAEELEESVEYTVVAAESA